MRCRQNALMKAQQRARRRRTSKSAWKRMIASCCAKTIYLARHHGRPAGHRRRRGTYWGDNDGWTNWFRRVGREIKKRGGGLRTSKDLMSPGVASLDLSRTNQQAPPLPLQHQQRRRKARGRGIQSPKKITMHMG